MKVIKVITGIMQPSSLHDLWNRVDQALNGKGQILSSEFIIACVIFMFVLASILLMWTITIHDIERSELVYSMDEAAINAAEKLIRTPGWPGDWVNLSMDDVSSIGLASSSRVLDQEKVLRFLDVLDNTSFTNPCNNSNISNYECNKHFMGLGRYHFHFNMTYLNGTTVRLGGTNCVTGLPPLDADYILSKKRNALLEDEIVNIDFMVWY